MARDDTARDLETERSPLDRRSHLRLAGATAASLATTGVAASAGASSSNITTVPAGEKRQFDTGDGETSENELDDITDSRLAGAAAEEVHDGLQ